MMSLDSISPRVITRLANFVTTVSLANKPAEWRGLSFDQLKATVESEIPNFSPRMSELACFPYPRLLVYVWTVLLQVDLKHETGLFASLQSQWAGWIALDQIAQIESSISIKYDLQGFIATHRQIFVESQVKDIIKLDMQNVAAIILTSLSDPETRRSLLERQSQRLLDVLQEILDCPSLCDVRPPILLATYEVSKRTGLYPKSLQLSGVEAVQLSDDRGSFGDIWKGKLSGHLVAIKVMRQNDPELLPAQRKAFIREAILWRNLCHPNVLAFHGIHLWPGNGRMCLVSPWMENGNLVSYLKANLNANRLALAIDIAQGLDYLHSFNPPIVHGDLKGNNILVTSDLRACVADFGLGKFTPTDGIFQFSQSTGIHGAFLWCAPELVTEERPTITLSSDIYALGCVFYEIFTGKTRFAHLTGILPLFTAVSSGAIPERPEAIDDNIWEMIIQCWTFNPTSRPIAPRVVEVLLAIQKHHTAWKSPSSTPIVRDAVQSNEKRETMRSSHSSVMSDTIFPKSLRLYGVEALQQSGDRGSFGDIWKGKWSGHLVAIKVMRQNDPELLPAWRKALIRKAMLWKDLSHPNVLAFYGMHLWPTGGRICLVSPWMENGNLVSYLKDHLDADRLALALDVAQGLEYLHHLNPPIIHGDLKGVNI
ncbi:kinase-like domain-containing protein [Mycena floridula]|nr:kinase-like domain-containing protein [Mycena floridula]